MSRALLALALATGGVLDAAQDRRPAVKKEPAPESPFEQAACAEPGGLLVRVAPGRQPAERPDPAALGLESVGSDASAFRVPGGERCPERLGALGRFGDELQVTAAPNDLPATTEELEQAFANAPTLRALSKVRFSSPAALASLFENSRAKGFLPALGEANAAGLIAGAGDAARGVRAETAPKPDLSGRPSSEFKPAQRLATADTPPPEHSEDDGHGYPRSLGGAWDYVADAVWRDRARERASDRSFASGSPRAETWSPPAGVDAPAQPMRVIQAGSAGWAELPSSGPGFRFTGKGRYGTRHLVSTLMAAAADPVNGAGAPVSVIAISLWPPGTYFPPHVTHRQGIDVDVALTGSSWWGRASRERDLRFALAVMERMQPRFILLDERRQGELRAVADQVLGGAVADEHFRSLVRKHYGALFRSAREAGSPRAQKIFSHVPGHGSHFHIQTTGSGLGR